MNDKFGTFVSYDTELMLLAAQQIELDATDARRDLICAARQEMFRVGEYFFDSQCLDRNLVHPDDAKQGS